MPANDITLDVKDQTLIVSDDIINDCRVVVIKNNNHLSDVFNSLPYGIVCKDETGMGATHLELVAPRPSIIVEPLKITASSKANKHGAVYYGSTTAQEPKPSPKQFKDRLLSLPSKKRKIVVVADSLNKVREIMKEEFKEYFLMIDEADSFQIDSTFRDSMAMCLDIYKEHPADKRALVTATPLAFSDDELQKEPNIRLQYNIPKVRNIELIHCNNINGTAIEVIKRILAQSPGDKIMVPYNSVGGCVDIASHLVTKESQPQEDIKILCSSASKGKARTFYHELEGDTLPGKINLVTSAYFTGFDLHERYHLVSISDANNPIFLLSDNRLKQVSGRCRNGLLSETVVYSTSQLTGDIPKVKDMVDAGKWEIKALECISFNYAKSPILEFNLSKIRDSIIDLTGDRGAQFVRKDINGKLEVNYLSIDAYIEGYRVSRELYKNKQQLEEALTNEGHNIILSASETNIHVTENRADKIDKAALVNSIIDNVVNKDSAELNDKLRNHNLGHLERTIIDTYIEYEPYIERADIIKILQSLSGRDNKKFTNMKAAAYLLTLNDNDNFKVMLQRYFKIGSALTQEKILEKWKKINAEVGLGINLRSLTETKAVHLTKLYFKTYKRKDTQKGDIIEMKITGINPMGFKLIKTRKDPTEKHTFKFKFA